MRDSIPCSVEEYRQWWRENAPVPYGFCWCGCGRETTPAPQNHTKNGWFKGEPRKWCWGHHAVRPTSDADYEVRDCGYSSPCWMWLRAFSNRGYPIINHRETEVSRSAHRLYYETYKGPVEQGVHVDHLCRNIQCVNPEHLEAVSAAINTRRGAAAKLDPEKVREIRRLCAKGWTACALGREHDVHPKTITDVRDRKSWRNV